MALAAEQGALWKHTALLSSSGPGTAHLGNV